MYPHLYLLRWWSNWWTFYKVCLAAVKCGRPAPRNICLYEFNFDFAWFGLFCIQRLPIVERGPVPMAKVFTDAQNNIGRTQAKSPQMHAGLKQIGLYKTCYCSWKRLAFSVFCRQPIISLGGPFINGAIFDMHTDYCVLFRSPMLWPLV